MRKRKTSRKTSRTLLVVGALFLLVFWPLGAVALFRGNAMGFAISLFFSGLQGPFLVGYAFARAPRKQLWRWFTLVIGGLGILVFSLIDAVDLDLHGFFELIILGTAGAAIGHTMVTTIAGPLIFGRILCGWGCWRAMVLERLPGGKGSGRRKGVWNWTPLFGVFLSLAVAAVLALVFDIQHGGATEYSVWRVINGVVVYYAAAIAMAMVLRDQRAFCKYLCPTGFVLRWTSRRALLRVSARAEACNDCGVCTKVCPMDIPVDERVRMGVHISQGDCILCQRCVECCPTKALKTSFTR